MTAVLEKYPVVQQAPSSHETFQSLKEAWSEYLPGQTEADLDLHYTQLEPLAGTGRHTVLALDETQQPGNNFKSNGMRWKIQRLMQQQSHLERLYIGSAGNAGAALASAGSAFGLDVIVDAPESLVSSKKALLNQYGSTVNAVHDSVEAATSAAAGRAAEDSLGAFVHPYDDIDAIAGQGMIGLRALEGLLTMQTSGQLDLQKDPVTFLVQRGGGSLLTGIACAVHEKKLQGLFGDNVRVTEVRPEESVHMYDGLNVVEAGTIARSVIEDREFVHDSISVNDEETGRAAQLLRRRYGPGILFEPSAMIGVSAFQKLRASTEKPTTFVTVLSGSNTSREVFTQFLDVPYQKSQERLRHLGSRTLEELQAQPFDPNNSRTKMLQFPWGRPQTA